MMVRPDALKVKELRLTPEDEPESPKRAIIEMEN